MAIQTVTNPVDGSEVTLAKGVIEKIIYREKTNQFGQTHQASCLIEGDWINVSLKTKEGREPGIRTNLSKNPSKPDWVDVNEGDEVNVVVKVNEWNGKNYYNTTPTKFNILKKGEGGSKQQASSTPKKVSGGKRNDGVVAGNARTAAFNFCKGERKSVNEMKQLISWFVEYSDNKRKEYKAAHPDMDDFEVGVSCGQAVVSAAEIAKTLDEVDGIVNEFLNELIPHSLEAVKNVGKAHVQQNSAIQSSETPTMDNGSPVADDEWDSDIPF